MVLKTVGLLNGPTHNAQAQRLGYRQEGYYNIKDRRLKLKSLCYYCVKSGSTSFVFEPEELKEKN